MSRADNYDLLNVEQDLEQDKQKEIEKRSKKIIQDEESRTSSQSSSSQAGLDTKEFLAAENKKAL